MSDNKKMNENKTLKDEELANVAGGIGRGDICYFFADPKALISKNQDGELRVKCGFKSCFAAHPNSEFITGYQYQCRCHGTYACVDSRHLCHSKGEKRDCSAI